MANDSDQVVLFKRFKKKEKLGTIYSTIVYLIMPSLIQKNLYILNSIANPWHTAYASACTAVYTTNAYQQFAAMAARKYFYEFRL